jgi:hypothetical protein
MRPEKMMQRSKVPSSGSNSLRLDVCRPDHLAPFLGLIRDVLAEVGWGA